MKYRRAHIDFESRSKVDIWESGAYVYATHPSTEPLCLAYAVDNGPVRIIRYDDIFTYPLSDPFEELRELANETDILFCSHSALFEQLIWRFKLQDRFNLPRLPINRWRCTAAKALAVGLPKSLAEAAMALGTKHKKDLRGRMVMLKLCKPDSKGRFIEDPALFAELEAYCARDVETERDIDNLLPELSPFEQVVWFEDQLINQRGVQVDTKLVTKILGILETTNTFWTERLQKLTGGEVDRATKGAAMLAYLKKHYKIDLPNFQKATVQEALDNKNLPPKALEILRVRQQLGRTSTAKYTALDIAQCQDGRLRDTFVYHAASTGRWGGKLVQLQNLPKGNFPSDLGVEMIDKYDYDTLALMCPDITDLLSSCVRGMFVSAPGHDLIVADYSAIEARVLMWFCGEDRAVKMFEEGADIYVDMAKRIGSDAPRQLGKQAVLACIAEDSMVYSDSGFIPIQTLNRGQRLWDGEQWVNFRELVCTGEKNVIQIGSLKLTPDHLLLTKSGWRSAGEIALSGDMQSLKLGEYSERGQLLAESITSGRHVMSLSAVRAVLNQAAESTIFGEEIRKRVKDVTKVLKAKKGETPASILVLSLIHAYVKDGAYVGITFNDVVMTRIASTTNGMVLAAFPSVSNPVESSWNMLLSYLSGTGGDIPSIELIMPKGTAPEIYESLLKERTITTKVKRCYDIIDTPRHRFQVGEYIAHNCGYGMGPDKFKATCATYGIKIDDILTKTAVSTYRTTYPKVPQMWYAQERAAIQAVSKGGAVPCGRVTWEKRGAFLWCKLPSGRELAYHKPELRVQDEMSPRLSYMTTDSTTKKYIRKDTYGGKIIENIIQAIARDILAAALFEAERHKYAPVMHVHDEIVAEVPEGFGSEKEFEKIICAVPAWAKGCPISAEAWRGKRYHK